MVVVVVVVEKVETLLEEDIISVGLVVDIEEDVLTFTEVDTLDPGDIICVETVVPGLVDDLIGAELIVCVVNISFFVDEGDVDDVLDVDEVMVVLDVAPDEDLLSDVERVVLDSVVAVLNAGLEVVVCAIVVLVDVAVVVTRI